MQGGISHERNVRLSVRLSVCQTRKLWQNERNLRRRSYTTWKNIHPGSLPTRMVDEGRLLLPKILGQSDRMERKRRFLIDIRW